ncbi:hypothetical protein GCM10020331_017550 [Ectobacillus funiculus]
MAKKSMIAKQKNASRSLKYRRIHVANAAVVRILYTANLNFAVFVSVNLPIKVKFLVLKKLAGNTQEWEGGKNKW